MNIARFHFRIILIQIRKATFPTLGKVAFPNNNSRRYLRMSYAHSKFESHRRIPTYMRIRIGKAMVLNIMKKKLKKLQNLNRPSYLTKSKIFCQVLKVCLQETKRTCKKLCTCSFENVFILTQFFSHNMKVNYLHNFYEKRDS